MGTGRTTEALALLRKIRERIHSGDSDIASLLRTFASVSRILDREKESEWIDRELQGYPESEAPGYRKLPVTWYNEYNDVIVVEDTLRIQPFLAPVTTASSNLARGVFFRPSKELSDEIYEQSRYHPAKYHVSGMFLRQMLEGLTNRLLEHADLLILELEYGGIPQSIFEERRKATDERLVGSSPEALGKLQAAFESLARGGPGDDWGPVAVACRKVIRDVADAVFPPREEPHKDKSGVARPVKSDDYINRILAFIDDNSTGTKRHLLKAQTQHLGDLLEEINGHASAAVHGEVTRYQASTCVIYTYLLLGDVLEIVDK